MFGQLIRGHAPVDAAYGLIVDELNRVAIVPEHGLDPILTHNGPAVARYQVFGSSVAHRIDAPVPLLEAAVGRAPDRVKIRKGPVEVVAA